MKFDLKWRYKQKIGEIEITDSSILSLLKLLDDEPLCLVPRLKISYDGNLETIKEKEIVDLSLIPSRLHRNREG